MAITILDVLHRRRHLKGLPKLETCSEQDFADQNLAMIGGCAGCQATLGAYNAYPQRNGYWSCLECLSAGFESHAEFEAFQRDQLEADEKELAEYEANAAAAAAAYDDQ